MNSPQKPSSKAVKASWASIALCVATTCLFALCLVGDQLSPYDRTGQGVLIGFLPRATLVVVWIGTTLTAITGIASLLLIRKADIETKAVYGVAGRGVFAIVAGLAGVLIMWLIVGHIVIGF